MLTEEEQLYLIDWDGAIVADPALDLGLLLYHYIDQSEWEKWLAQYGVQALNVETPILENIFW